MNAFTNINVYLTITPFAALLEDILNTDLLNDLAMVTQNVWGRVLNCLRPKTPEFYFTIFCQYGSLQFFVSVALISVQIISMDLSTQEIPVIICEGCVVFAA